MSYLLVVPEDRTLFADSTPNISDQEVIIVYHWSRVGGEISVKEFNAVLVLPLIAWSEGWDCEPNHAIDIIISSGGFYRLIKVMSDKDNRRKNKPRFRITLIILWGSSMQHRRRSFVVVFGFIHRSVLKILKVLTLLRPSRISQWQSSNYNTPLPFPEATTFLTLYNFDREFLTHSISIRSD